MQLEWLLRLNRSFRSVHLVRMLSPLRRLIRRRGSRWGRRLLRLLRVCPVRRWNNSPLRPPIPPRLFHPAAATSPPTLGVVLLILSPLSSPTPTRHQHQTVQKVTVQKAKKPNRNPAGTAPTAAAAAVVATPPTAVRRRRATDRGKSAAARGRTLPLVIATAATRSPMTRDPAPLVEHRSRRLPRTAEAAAAAAAAATKVAATTGVAATGAPPLQHRDPAEIGDTAAERRPAAPTIVHVAVSIVAGVIAIGKESTAVSITVVDDTTSPGHRLEIEGTTTRNRELT